MRWHYAQHLQEGRDMMLVVQVMLVLMVDYVYVLVPPAFSLMLLNYDYFQSIIILNIYPPYATAQSTTSKTTRLAVTNCLL